MAVGDVNSDKPGSGARYNDGKLQMDLMPVCYWLNSWLRSGALATRPDALVALEALCAFQAGDDHAIGDYMEGLPEDALVLATKVLEYGVKKYAAWNWAKGMAWSVPTGCILRHARALIAGEEHDAESGELHIAHIVCNMMMLAWFVDEYPEGDDRPPVRKLDQGPGHD